MMKKLMFIFLGMPALGATCPAGMVAVEYDAFVPAMAGACPAGYVAHDVSDVCSADATGACWLIEQLRALCGAGITKLNTSGGLSFPLYSDKSTSPSLHIKYNDTVCYVDLEVSNSPNAINIKYNGVVYHTAK